MNVCRGLCTLNYPTTHKNCTASQITSEAILYPLLSRCWHLCSRIPLRWPHLLLRRCAVRVALRRVAWRWGLVDVGHLLLWRCLH